MTISTVLFSNRSEEWPTPLQFFQSLDNEFDFTLDPLRRAGTRNAGASSPSSKTALTRIEGPIASSTTRPMVGISGNGRASALRLRNGALLLCCCSRPHRHALVS